MNLMELIGNSPFKKSLRTTSPFPCGEEGINTVNTYVDLIMMDLRKVQLQKLALERQFNYKFETTFWEEFSISDQYGPEGVVEHYNLVFDQWKDNLKYLTELVLVLNWKIAQWYQVDDNLGLTYDDLWKRTDGYAMETLKGDDLHYYLSTLD